MSVRWNRTLKKGKKRGKNSKRGPFGGLDLFWRKVKNLEKAAADAHREPPEKDRNRENKVAKMESEMCGEKKTVLSKAGQDEN